MKIVVDNFNFFAAAQKASAVVNGLLVSRDLTFRINYNRLLFDLAAEGRGEPLQIHFFGTKQVPFDALAKEDHLNQNQTVHCAATDEEAGNLFRLHLAMLSFLPLFSAEKTREDVVVLVGDRKIDLEVRSMLDNGHRVKIVTFASSLSPGLVRQANAQLKIVCLDLLFKPNVQTAKWPIPTLLRIYGYNETKWAQGMPAHNSICVTLNEPMNIQKIYRMIKIATSVLRIPFRYKIEGGRIFLITAYFLTDRLDFNRVLVDKLQTLQTELGKIAACSLTL